MLRLAERVWSYVVAARASYSATPREPEQPARDPGAILFICGAEALQELRFLRPHDADVLHHRQRYYVLQEERRAQEETNAQQQEQAAEPDGVAAVLIGPVLDENLWWLAGVGRALAASTEKTVAPPL